MQLKEDMSTKFCSNPKCSYHDVLINKYTFEITVVSEGEQNKTMKRHSHKSKDRSNELFFCDICHEAVELLKEIDNQPDMVVH